MNTCTPVIAEKFLENFQGEQDRRLKINEENTTKLSQGDMDVIWWPLEVGRGLSKCGI